MKYLFEQPDITCESFEKELGVARGAIKTITIYSSGAVEIDCADSVSQSALKTALAKRGLPKGTKPEV